MPSPATPAQRKLTARTRASRWLYGHMLIGNIERLARATRHVPWWRPERAGVEVIADLPYAATDHPRQRLDIYRPRDTPGPLPVALYIHGGGFRYFDRKTHWMIASHLARQGYLVFNVDYRTSTEAPFPAAFDDCAQALLWVLANAGTYGGDTTRMIWAGESAGANLVLALTIAAHWPRPEPLARAIFDAAPAPAALLPACGYLEISRPERHAEAYEIPKWMQVRIHEVSDIYLPDHAEGVAEHDLANPLTFLERAGAPARGLPPAFTVVGDRDPVRGDSLRLPAALGRHGGRAELRVFEGAGHAFHGVPGRRQAGEAWAAQLEFAARCLAGGAGAGESAAGVAVAAAGRPVTAR
ncbi:MAG: alpha/beta hydrolase fold domain-containing protein [Myxococcota bacterium]